MAYRYFIKLSFDGTNYSGWQIQDNTPNTVQQVLNNNLSKLLNEKICVHGCCRTDAGVHAKELFAHFDSEKNLTANPSSPKAGTYLNEKEQKKNENWLYKFNCVLPPDISADEIIPVKNDASARFDATSRTYQYFITQKRNSFLLNRIYYCYGNLNLPLMKDATKILKEYDDFTSFSKLNTQTKTNICKITETKLDILPLFPYSLNNDMQEVFVFTITANRFLRGMVRMIIGTIAEVGKKNITLKNFREIIESKDCRNAKMALPAYGLYLIQVKYPQKIFL